MSYITLLRGRVQQLRPRAHDVFDRFNLNNNCIRRTITMQREVCEIPDLDFFYF